MRSAVNRRSNIGARHAGRARRAADGSHGLVEVSTMKPLTPSVDDLGHRAGPPGDDRRAARHRLDHHQPERLAPSRSGRAARCASPRKSAFVGSADLADELDERRLEQRLDLPLEVLAIGVVDLGGDAQRHARCGARSRSPGRRASRARCGRGRRGTRRARSAASSTSGGRPWWTVATQLACGSGSRWSFEIETTGMSLNSA